MRPGNLRGLAVCALICCMALRDAPNEKATEIARITDRRVSEASGIVASRRFPGVYWTHNDGDDNRLFAIRRDGSVIGFAKLDVNVHDWEDIAIDDDGYLYVSDTGNNSGNRKHLMICRVREPDPNKLAGRKMRTLKVDESWKVHFPGEPFNCESLFVWRGEFYLISKLAAGTQAEVYRFDPKGKTPEMRKVATLPIDQPVTAADISADGNELAVLAHGALWIFQIGGDVTRSTEVKPTRISVPPGKVEGCCFADGEILIVAESGEIFAAPHKTSATTQP